MIQLNYAQILQKKLEEQPYQEITGILQKVCRGELFLIGGFVYRTLVTSIHNTPSDKYDMDFCVQGTVDDSQTKILFESCESHPKFNGLRIRHKTIPIDLFTLNNFIRIKTRNTTPSIHEYLKQVPFTIQAIAYNIRNKSIINGGAIQAIMSKEIAVNNKENFLQEQEWLSKKAVLKSQQLGLTCVI